MLWTIIILLLVLWLLGFVGGIGAAALGNFVHLFIAAAIILFVVKFATGNGGNRSDGLGL